MNGESATRWGLILFLVAMGCSQEKLTELVQRGKDSISQGVDQVQQSASQVSQGANDAATAVADQAKQKLQMAGEFSLQLNGPIKTASCFGFFVSSEDGRPAVLKFQSYRQAGSESFPSLLVQSQVSAKNLGELVGQTLPATLYVQTALNGPIWVSNSAQPVQLRVTKVEDKQVFAEIAGGTMRQLDGSTTASVSGQLIASM